MKANTLQVHAALGMLLFLPAVAYGQANRATLTGTVSDASGAVVPNVQVVATNVGTQTRYPATTTSVGIYTISGLPVGPYTLDVSQTGFKTFKRSDISLMASQVLEVNIRLETGALVETVQVTGAPPLLETQGATVATTMEEKAIRELPLDANGGRNALKLLVAVTPSVAANSTINATGTQNWVSIGGGEQMSNSIFIDGTNATASNQGMAITPGQDALQEMQIQSHVTDAELAASAGASITYALKSGTNQFHGSAFEFLQNEALNANSWAQNQFLSTCSPGDTGCVQSHSRQKFRFNDYGVSAGGPIWKDHTFVFGSYEYYTQSDYRQNPTGFTAPTADLLQGDFSRLLTEGTRTGAITHPDGTPWINPCTSSPYQYGQIFDPTTYKVIDGQGCATPFANNIIPASRLSNVSKKLAADYTKYYNPVIDRLTNGNYPTLSAATSEYWKRNFDIKVDHNFSDRHHLSGSYNRQTDESHQGGMWEGPFASIFNFADTDHMARVVDNYTLTPTLVNTASFAWNYNGSPQEPLYKNDTSQYGFSVPGDVFPSISYGNAVNGIGFSNIGNGWDLYMNYSTYNFADTLGWVKGRHSAKFGVQFTKHLLDSQNMSLGEQQYAFVNTTTGPTDPGLTPWVGSGLANFMLGNANYVALQQKKTFDPSQSLFALFAQDSFKVNTKLTLDLGLRWDVTLPQHMSTWQNFDINANNSAWTPYKGAWVLANGSSFQKNIPYNQFGPHVGMAFQASDKLVFRASYGLFYMPLGAFGSGGDSYYPGNQNYSSYGVNELRTNDPAAIVYNWDQPYSGTTVMPASTYLGGNDRVMYIHPDMLKLGHSNNLYAGVQYEIARNVLLDARYQGTFGGNLYDPGKSHGITYTNDWNLYNSLLQAGTISNQITSAADAAAVGVPYPYPGFNGPAWAAISPYPQVAEGNRRLQDIGDPAYSSRSRYNALIAEMRIRNRHGLYVNWSYTLSKQTYDGCGFNNFSNNWGTCFQSPADGGLYTLGTDRRHVAKGYVTYDLPFGKNQAWLGNVSRPVDFLVGGWTLGFYGEYGSGMPIGTIGGGYNLPYYYAGSRALFANGATAESLSNQFQGNLDLLHPGAASNYDFPASAFARTSQAAPFGNTPMTFNNWRWNTFPARENLSIVKRFGFGPDGRYRLQLRGELYNMFNRHYFNGPDTNINSSTFGYITSTAGSSRVGQLAARVEW